ncbi:uncharacterized protein A4U43_C07F19080 [Asparagus officinalis]|uniref:Uncharacterized protein n=1 Tax=Asparagus officinalis TaxID=4686 RepID=A0A5P1EGI4_ASPOF|nr:uncharacterized protein A4U43_C07F19080 [Asparagus officinalis]
MVILGSAIKPKRHHSNSLQRYASARSGHQAKGLGKGERRCGWRRRPEVALREVVNGGGARCGGGEVLGRGAWIWGSLASRLGRTWVAGDGGQRWWSRASTGHRGAWGGSGACLEDCKREIVG